MSNTLARTADQPGRCDCCMTKYDTGAQLHQELGRFWVLDVHPPFEYRQPKK